MIFVRGSSILRSRRDEEKKGTKRRKNGNDITLRKQNNTESGQPLLAQRVALKKSSTMIKEPRR